jgi:hypothetical protein
MHDALLREATSRKRPRCFTTEFFHSFRVDNGPGEVGLTFCACCLTTWYALEKEGTTRLDVGHCNGSTSHRELARGEDLDLNLYLLFLYAVRANES